MSDDLRTSEDCSLQRIEPLAVPEGAGGAERLIEGYKGLGATSAAGVTNSLDIESGDPGCDPGWPNPGPEDLPSRFLGEQRVPTERRAQPKVDGLSEI